MRRRTLLAGWLASFLAALLTGGVFVAGVARDTRAGEPVLAVDLSRASARLARSFRVWGSGSYRLFLSAVNHDSTHVGAPFAGGLEVAITDPGGRTVFERSYAPGVLNFRLPYNYGDVELAALPLSARPLRRWTLAVRITEGDPRFAGARAELKLWKQRADPGMSGMMNYVMVFPTGFFGLLALALAVPLARQGLRLPLALSLVVGLSFLFLVTG